jgi:hypothetical protein
MLNRRQAISLKVISRLPVDSNVGLWKIATDCTKAYQSVEEHHSVTRSLSDGTSSGCGCLG